MIEVRYNKKIHTRMGIVMKKKNVFLWTILTGVFCKMKVQKFAAQ